MKKPAFCLICFLALIFIIGCDPGGASVIEIVNNSTYDLHINFIPRGHYSPNNDKNEFALNKNETKSLRLTSMGGYPEPHETFEKLIFMDLTSGEIIREIDVDKTGVFELIRVDRKKRGFTYHRTAYFKYEINNNLLERN